MGKGSGGCDRPSIGLQSAIAGNAGDMELDLDRDELETLELMEIITARFTELGGPNLSFIVSDFLKTPLNTPHVSKKDLKGAIKSLHSKGLIERTRSGHYKLA